MQENRCRDNDVASFPTRTKLCSTGRKRIPLIKDHRSGPQCAFFPPIDRGRKRGERYRAVEKERRESASGCEGKRRMSGQGEGEVKRR